jgi:hypothetical protein
MNDNISKLKKKIALKGQELNSYKKQLNKEITNSTIKWMPYSSLLYETYSTHNGFDFVNAQLEYDVNFDNVEYYKEFKKSLNMYIVTYELALFLNGDFNYNDCTFYICKDSNDKLFSRDCLNDEKNMNGIFFKDKETCNMAIDILNDLKAINENYI